MTTQKTRARGEAGFALIVALLALMLLTFLGMTLAATTSTELQIATNYRWSQQALYNAEAGLEISRSVLSQVADGQLVLPAARAGSWTPPVPTPVPSSQMPAPTFTTPTRNFENSACDSWGNGAGFGQVLVDPGNAAAPYENVSALFGRALSGDFTVWVRRDLVFNADGTLSDSPVGESVIVTAEGAAPFRSVGTAGAAGAFAQANRAVRRLETRVSIREGCRPGHSEESATGFSGCEGI